MILDKPAFSADGKHLFFKGERKTEGGTPKRFIVCDGVEGPQHDFLWILKDYEAYPDRLRYVMADDEKAWLVEVDWPKGLDWTNGLRPIEPPKERTPLIAAAPWARRWRTRCWKRL